MIPIFRSLAQISTGYTVFEQDQVLTHEQLNSLADYADDQIRLTRMKLMGVGVMCGLNPSRNGDRVIVTKGVGVTTDGDLLYLDANTTFTHFRRYGTSFPQYPPLYQGGNLAGPMYPAAELLTSDTGESGVLPLSNLFAEVGFSLSNAFVAIIMESYIKDDDICSGTDCDNLGKEAKNRIKVIVLDQNGANSLRENVPTANSAFDALAELVIERPIVTSAVRTATDFAKLYRDSCRNINTSLVAALGSIYPACASFIGDVFPSDPSGGWAGRLTALSTTTFQNSDNKIQYYYDFLKDLADTYNEFRNLLFGDTTICSPGYATFPKHLLIGDLAMPGITLGEYRTGFYPVATQGGSRNALDHAKFLLRKLDLMINTFDVNVATPAIRITPSQFEERTLEDRAIPYYYPANTTTQVHTRWNFDLYWRGRSVSNQSYNAPLYSGPASPLGSQLGRYGFFRIEGHVGVNVTTAMATIKNAIAANNLPFSVQAVHVGTDRSKVTVKPQVRYTPLHQMSYVMRQDVANQLDDVVRFSGALKAKVDAEPSTLSVDTEVCNCAPRAYAATASVDLVNKANTVRAKLDRPYTAYAADASWTDLMKNTLVTAGQYKATLSAVAKTDFLSPADGLMVSPSITLLPSIDTLIKKNDEAEDDKLLLTNFVTCHSSVEHFAGVRRGGTFVLVYGSDNLVVGDFMLPYYIVDCPAATIDEPPIPRPEIKTTYVVNEGVKIQPSRTTVVNNIVNPAISGIRAEVNSTVDNKLTLHSANVTNKLDVQTASVNSALQFQNSYVDLFQNSLGMLGGAAPRADQVAYANAAMRQADTGEFQADALNRVANAGESTATSTGQMAASTGQMATSTGQMATSTGQMAASTGQMATSAAQSATAAGRIAAAGERSATAGEASAASTGSIATSSSQIATSASQTAAATGRVAAANEASATSTGQIATSTGSIATSSSQIATSASQTAAATGRVTAANEASATSTGQIATSTGHIATSSGQIATSTGQIATSSDQIATSTGQIATSAEQMATASERIARAEERSADAAESGGGGGAHYSDDFLTATVNENSAEADKINSLRAKGAAAGGAFGQWCNEQTTTVEQELADSTMVFVYYLEAHVKYDDAAAYDLGPGSEAASAAAVITANLSALTVRSIKDRLQQNIDGVSKRISNEDLITLLQIMFDALA